MGPSIIRSALAFCLLGTLSGCSFLFVTPPPADHLQLTEVKCTARRVSPIMDTLIASGSGLLAFAQFTEADIAIRTTSGRVGFGLATLGAALLFGTSAVNGFVNVSECREALAALENRRVVALQQTPAIPVAPTYYAPPPIQPATPPMPPAAPTPPTPPAPHEAPVLLFPDPPPPVPTAP